MKCCLFCFCFCFYIFCYIFIFKIRFYKNSSFTGSTNGVNDCCLTPNVPVFRYIMASLSMEDDGYPKTCLTSYIAVSYIYEHQLTLLLYTFHVYFVSRFFLVIASVLCSPFEWKRIAAGIFIICIYIHVHVYIYALQLET